MTRFSITCLTLAVFLGLNAPAVMAAPGASATYRLTVTLPPSVQMAPAQETMTAPFFSETDRRQVTEKIVMRDDRQRVLLRTTVVR